MNALGTASLQGKYSLRRNKTSHSTASSTHIVTFTKVIRLIMTSHGPLAALAYAAYVWGLGRTQVSSLHPSLISSACDRHVGKLGDTSNLINGKAPVHLH